MYHWTQPPRLRHLINLFLKSNTAITTCVFHIYLAHSWLNLVKHFFLPLPRNLRRGSMHLDIQLDRLPLTLRNIHLSILAAVAITVRITNLRSLFALPADSNIKHQRLPSSQTVYSDHKTLSYQSNFLKRITELIDCT